MGDERNNRKYKDYKKYLAFDCDAPPDIQSVICNMRDSDVDYHLLISNKLFETWLLMYFEDVNQVMSKSKVYRHLENHLHGKLYRKARKGLIREILHNGNVELAIENAGRLRKQHVDAELSVYRDVRRMNPYTSVHDLVEQFMIALTKRR
jgi:hypothetical protein